MSDAPKITLATRVISLRRPWAAALLGEPPEDGEDASRGTFFKDVENRSQPPPATGWYLVLSSKARPRADELKTLRRILLETGEADRFYSRGCGTGEPAALMGWIYVAGHYYGDRGNAWESPGACHWQVTDSIRFKHPIREIPGCQSLTRFVKSYKDDVRERIFASGH